MAVYPFVSNFQYEKQQERMILDMDETDLDASFLTAERNAAQEYNRYLLEENIVLTDPFDPTAFSVEPDAGYENILNPYDNGMMGYLEIPAIDLQLGIYHGTSEQVLKDGVGHLENTSLPVGGEDTHAVLSAHTGLSDKKLFTDLVLLEAGDRFYIHVLDEVLAYEVDQISVVEPEDTSLLGVISGEDHVTLVTCTPYGVNSHRLLVRGTRIPYVPEEKETEDRTSWFRSGWMRQYALAVGCGTAAAIAFLILGLAAEKKKRTAGTE